MKRELTSHKVNGLNDKLGIVVLDEPGAGGANHRYCIFRGYDTVNQELNANPTCYIDFQKGPIGEVGINGISNEALLAIVEDRLAGFQSGPFACGSNQMALIHVQSAMDVLHARTKKRVARGAGFQSGPFACGSNQMALIHVQSAMDVLHTRTKERVARGVEGTLQQ